MKPSCAVFALALTLPIGARAQDPIESNLFAARNLLCEYGAGTFAEYEGVIGIESGPDLLPESSLSPAQFTNIDLDGGRANLFDATVAVLRSGPALHFVETTPGGSLVVTTVFATVFNDSGAYVAVTSRHIATAAGVPPMPSQYHGSCVPY
jgi:hypothetical protein